MTEEEQQERELILRDIREWITPEALVEIESGTIKISMVRDLHGNVCDAVAHRKKRLEEEPNATEETAGLKAGG